MSSTGHVASIHTAHGATVSHTAHGGRSISSEHTNARGEHIRSVSTSRRGGYVDHTYVRGGQPYMRRTYVVNGQVYARAYPGYYYQGYAYYGYSPAYYYGPAYYGWAYNPWAGPVSWGWGWGGAPWYGYYGYYFNPYPVYASASFWLTDYLISQNLSAAYEAGVAAGQSSGGDGGGGGQVPAEYSSNSGDSGNGGDNGNSGGGSQQVVLTPEVKQAIADEVKAELAAEKAEAEAPQVQASAAPAGDHVPAALDPKFRTFIVSAGLTEPMADGTECSLSQGDVLTRIDDNPDADQNVKVLVSSSQKNDCNAGVQVSIAVTDLQDMHNAFREKMDDGLKTLADNQGKNGLPAAPSTATTTNANVKASPDMDAATALQDQQKDADDAEKDVAQSNTTGGTNQNQ